MRFFHLSDLHIGKQFYGYSLLEDQEWILQEILQLAGKQYPDAIVISGDIYDKSVPSAEAVALFDRFLCGLAGMKPSIPVMIISGNHDSPERLTFAGEILEQQQVYIEGLPPMEEREKIKKVVLEDSWGTVEFWLLPFVKPGYVKNIFGRKEPESYQEAVQGLLEREEELQSPGRKVLLTHQFYICGGEKPKQSESEIITVGGLDQVDISCLKGFDYAALGHIHRPQNMGVPWVRYCGTPLKYSVSEWNQEKCLTEVELREPGSEPVIRCYPLHPLRDVRLLRGNLEEILRENTEVSSDYVSVILTDEKDPYQPRERLEAVFPRILEVRMENTRTGKLGWEEEEPETEADPGEVFRTFFRQMQGREMDEEEQEVLAEVFRKVEEESV